MSYFLVALGTVPEPPTALGVSLVPALDTQAYVTEAVMKIYPRAWWTRCYLVDDGSGTSSFKDTGLGTVVTSCVEAGCSLRIWWAFGVNPYQNVRVYTDRESFLMAVESGLRAGRELAQAFEPDPMRGQLV
jgi:hypothetical protein